MNICFHLEQTWRSRVVGRARTIGNRVYPIRVSRVRIPSSPPQKNVPPTGGTFFVAEKRLRRNYPLRSIFVRGSYPPLSRSPHAVLESTFFPFGDSNHVRKPRWGFREPVQTLANSFILFSPPRKENASESLLGCKNPLQSAFGRLFYYGRLRKSGVYDKMALNIAKVFRRGIQT